MFGFLFSWFIGKWGQKISCTKPKHCLTPGFLIHLLLPNRLRGFRCRTRSRAWSRSSCRALSSSWPRTAPSSPYRSRRRSSAPWWAIGRIYSVLEVLWLRLRNRRRNRSRNQIFIIFHKILIPLPIPIPVKSIFLLYWNRFQNRISMIPIPAKNGIITPLIFTQALLLFWCKFMPVFMRYSFGKASKQYLKSLL